MNYLEPISVIGIFILSFILIKRNFQLSLYLLLVLSILLHKELFSFYKWDLLPVRIFMFAMLCSFAVEIVRKLLSPAGRKSINQMITKNPFLILLLLLWLVYGASIVYTFNLKASVLLYGFFTTIIVLAIKLFSTFDQQPQLPKAYIKFYIILAFLMTLFGYFQFYLYEKTGKIIGALWNVPNNIPRIGSTFWDINHYGAFLAALLPLSAVFVITEKSIKSKLFFAVASFSILLSVLLTNSRTAWIMCFVSFIAFALVFLVRYLGKKGLVYLVTALTISILFVTVLYSQKQGSFRATVKQYFHYRLDSFDSHILLLEGAFEIFQKYPVLGGGYGGFFEHFSKTKIAPIFYGRDPAALNTRVPAHTIWGELIAESGIVGLSIYLLFVFCVLGTILYAAISSRDKNGFLINSAMAATLFGWLFAGIFYSYNSEFFWLIWIFYVSYALSQLDLKGNYRQILEYYSASGWVPKTVILSTCFLLLVWSLGTNHLIPWDEAIYAKIAKNMIVSGDYITQHWVPGKIWYEKPPLYMWIEAMLMLCLGFSSWAVRIPSMLAGLFTLVLVYKISEKLFGKTAAFISTLSLATTVHFLYYARTGMLDISVTFFMTLAFYLYFIAKNNSGKSLLFLLIGIGAAAGSAVMTKGVVGLFALILLFIFELISSKKFKFGHYLIILISFLLIALPWHLMMYKLYGFNFLNNYIGYHVVDRATNAIEDKGNPIWWYFIIIKVSMRIWFISLIAAFPFSIYKVIKKDNRTLPFIIWASFIFVLFSLAKSKLVWYIIPVYPALAIINGYFLSETLNFGLNKFPAKMRLLLKPLSLYVLLIFSLLYLILNKDLVYTSDLTGSQARLMQTEQQVFGTKYKVYLDRIELPLALYYLDSEFETIDFSPVNSKRVPKVPDNMPLILLTKKGRFSQQVAGYTLPSVVVSEDGDWILWYLDAKKPQPKSAPL